MTSKKLKQKKEALEQEVQNLSVKLYEKVQQQAQQRNQQQDSKDDKRR